MTFTHFREATLNKFSGAITKIKMIQMMGGLKSHRRQKSDGKKSKKRFVDMNYIRKLNEGDSKKQFQKKGNLSLVFNNK